MINIICFGDSNTFGFNPKDGSRYDSDTRWASLLGKILGKDFNVTEEGCNDRTGFFLNQKGPFQSGGNYLPKCLEKHKNFDIFILALGTNDLQKFYTLDETIAKNGLKTLINVIRNSNPKTRIIIIPPIILSEDILKGYFVCQFNENSIIASHWIQEIYKTVSQEESCELLDLNKFVFPSVVDGLHFDANSHKTIAEKIASKILKKNSKNIDIELAENY